MNTTISSLTSSVTGVCPSFLPRNTGKLFTLSIKVKYSSAGKHVGWHIKSTADVVFQSKLSTTLIMSWRVQIYPLPSPLLQNTEQVLPYDFRLIIHLVIYTTCSKIMSWLFEKKSWHHISAVQVQRQDAHTDTSNSALLMSFVVCMLLLLSFSVCCFGGMLIMLSQLLHYLHQA